ncbi:N-(5'-phosphoribosyl)anthranilate isomerase [Rhodocytophaga rosea]|uniref:N-(5'-phosphoribosyl)anthranilate isomerase n=1 Tax=Rhodocytophaga rosea TaxID=2704465 RepID=A0A6C0GTQ7_9BACT|nr:N-(5'-phosphoribosyl)anthranilate isomerase [Rhodocytophaga rosea]QHT71551.1 N-(5'-phosphoribosyl)anthranilate isomerase [Rhodocytophaga rosea]
MALKTIVIVNGITNLSDARYCAGMGVEMLGFELDASSPGYVEPQTFKVINEWVAGIKKVGELPRAEYTDLKSLLATYSLDYLQTEDSDNWEELHSAGIPLICKVIWQERWTITDFQQKYKPVAPYVDFFLVEVISFTEELLVTIGEVTALYPVLLDAGGMLVDVEKLLADTSIKGIALKGSHEIRPGLKDFDQLAQILEQLEVED